MNSPKYVQVYLHSQKVLGPSEARGDTIYSDGGTSNQYKRMKISHGSGRGEGVVSKSYIHEQTQALLDIQCAFDISLMRLYIATMKYI